jgi:hypothetical protein
MATSPLSGEVTQVNGKHSTLRPNAQTTPIAGEGQLNVWLRLVFMCLLWPHITNKPTAPQAQIL